MVSSSANAISVLTKVFLPQSPKGDFCETSKSNEFFLRQGMGVMLEMIRVYFNIGLSPNVLTFELLQHKNKVTLTSQPPFGRHLVYSSSCHLTGLLLRWKSDVFLGVAGKGCNARDDQSLFGYRKSPNILLWNFFNTKIWSP